ncbi:hypothetical protein PGC35_19590 [Psychrobacillus sp. PGGUH221]|uniref:hypothetical protein n=1 Tax=Psychrobacillus sp. PGGUH221 TaxID=3020058 RepID=UPI0035C6DAE7
MASFILGIVGLIAVFFVEDISRVTGEKNRSILLVSALTIFVLILSSLFSIVKANSNRIRRELVISVLFAIIPLSALVINGLIFTVYFIGK